MSDDHSRACRLFLERHGDHALRLARDVARAFDLADEADDVLQDAVEILLRKWARCTPSVRPAAGRCAWCQGEATRRVALTRRAVLCCEGCLAEAVDDLRRGYLSGILRRVAHRAWERRRRRAPLDEDVGAAAREAVAHGVDVEHEAVRRWVAAETGAALHALPARQRDVLLVRHVEGRSVAETAAQLGLSEPSVKMAAHRGSRRLRASLPADVVELFARPPTADPTAPADPTATADPPPADPTAPAPERSTS